MGILQARILQWVTMPSSRRSPSGQRSTLVHILPVWMRYRNQTCFQVPLPSPIYTLIILNIFSTLRTTSHVIFFASNVIHNAEICGGESLLYLTFFFFWPYCQVWEIFSCHFSNHFFIPTLPLLPFWDSRDPVAMTSSMGGLSRVSFEEDMHGWAGLVFISIM